MAPNYGLLVKEAIVLLDKFKPNRQSLEDFLKDASKDLQHMKNLDKKFIFDVVSGCVEHKKLLDAVINVFYDQNQGILLRRDRSKFVVICYLTTFALGDLGLKDFKSIVKSLDDKIMQMFLTFFFKHLTTWIQAKWNNVYDAAYVAEQWIDPLLRWRPEIEILMEQVSAESYHGNMFKKAPIKTTKPKEFSFTTPKPRPLPMPELIPLQRKTKPVPTSTYRAPKEKKMIEETKLKNQQICQELLYEANLKQFKCVKPQKSEQTKRMMSQIKAESDSKLQFNSLHAFSPPASNKTNDAPIKKNRAAILKREAKEKQQVEKEIQSVENTAAGAFEPSAFYQWQKDIREKDLQVEREKIDIRVEQRYTDNVKGVKARKLLTVHNQSAAQLKKEETAELMRTYAEEKLKDKKEIKDLVQLVAGGHINARTAKEKLKGLNQCIVREVSRQNREILRKALEKEEAELNKKLDIIQEIHAIESVPHIRFRKFDDTETTGDGILGEMSLFELKERLVHLKEQQQRELQEKRERILANKQREKRHLRLLGERQQKEDNDKREQRQAAAIRKKGERNTGLYLQKEEPKSEHVLARRREAGKERQESQRIKDEDRQRMKGFLGKKKTQTSQQIEKRWR